MSRPGFALVYALFLVSALALLGLGLMATGAAELLIASALARQEQARALAEGAALNIVEQWSTRRYADMAIGATVTGAVPDGAADGDPDGDAGSGITRLDGSLYLVEAHGRFPPRAPPERAAVARAALLVRTLQPEALESIFPAAVNAVERAEIHDGLVSGESLCGPPSPGLHTPAPDLGPDASVLGDPPVRAAPLDPPPGLDPSGPELAPALATLSPRPGMVVPRPLAGPDGCIADSRNWGSPDPGHACYTARPFIHVPGSLTMSGGEGHGILVVEGDLRLAAGARFAGIIVVRGQLIIEDGSRVHGAVRADRVRILDGRVQRDGCMIQDVLRAPALDRAFRPRGRWWVPVF